MPTTPEEVAARFAAGGSVLSVTPHGAGHINDTYDVALRSGRGEARRFILQRINPHVFRDPRAVVRNAERVVEHLRARAAAEGGDPAREVPTLVVTEDGATSVRDDAGGVWRGYVRIEGATARPIVSGPRQARTVASSFGRFLRRLNDMPADRLEITIPGFHDLAGHLHALEDVVRRDPHGRAGGATEERSFVDHHRDSASAWTELVASDGISVRPAHNDTKPNNVLIDDETGEGMCVIDLDTVMAGSALVDLGDCIRAVMTGPEETGRAVDLDLFDAVVRGFVEEAGGLLTDTEAAHIVDAARAIALELGIRFLADYLSGDRWFPASRPTENLDRSRVQFDLVRGIEAREDEMRRIVQRALGRGARRRGPAASDAVRFRIDGGRART